VPSVTHPTPIRPPEEAYPGQTDEWTFRGIHYVFREVTVEENDACLDAAINPDGNTINNRTMTRLLILKSTVEPRGFSLQDLVKLPFRAYQHIVDIVNDLNDSEKIPEDPNDSTPDTSDAVK
jgi:hypothetical protein